jgi:hypothetical protein
MLVAEFEEFQIFKTSNLKTLTNSPDNTVDSVTWHPTNEVFVKTKFDSKILTIIWEGI